MLEIGKLTVQEVLDTFYKDFYKEKDQHWEEWLKVTESQMPSEEEMIPYKEDRDLAQYQTMQRSMFELIKEAVRCEQYKTPINELDNVERVVKFRIRLSREEIHKVLKIKTFSIYGVGLFTTLEGLMLSSATRNSSGYDTKGKHAYFDISNFSPEVREAYDFRLAIPAMGGLFVPKKCALTRWLDSTKQLQYFDISYDCVK